MSESTRPATESTEERDRPQRDSARSDGTPNDGAEDEPSVGSGWAQWKRAAKADLRTARDVVMGWDIFDLVATLTVVLVLVYHAGLPAFDVSLKIFCVAALVYRPLYRWPWFWFALGIFQAFSYGLMWQSADNHKFLIIYWCLALGFSALSTDTKKTLRTNARLLLGLVFLLAVVWKLRTPNFLDGGFMHHSFLLGSRFEEVAKLAGGLDAGTLYQNHELRSALTSYDSTLHQVTLHSTPRLAWIAQGLAWWTVGLEGVIAVGFLAPRRWLVSRWRDLPLIVFLLTTYAVAYVVSFAWILAILGLAQPSRSLRYGRLLYLFAFFMILVYGYDWSRVFAVLFG